MNEFSRNDIIAKLNLGDKIAHLSNPCIAIREDQIGMHSDSQWFVHGDIVELLSTNIISDFVATHPDYGRVEGNLDEFVFATEEGINDFLDHIEIEVIDLDEE